MFHKCSLADPWLEISSLNNHLVQLGSMIVAFVSKQGHALFTKAQLAYQGTKLPFKGDCQFYWWDYLCRGLESWQLIPHKSKSVLSILFCITSALNIFSTGLSALLQQCTGSQYPWKRGVQAFCLLFCQHLAVPLMECWRSTMKAYIVGIA